MRQKDRTAGPFSGSLESRSSLTHDVAAEIGRGRTRLGCGTIVGTPGRAFMLLPSVLFFAELSLALFMKVPRR